MSGTYIDKDKPYNATYQSLPNPLILYGGSVRFTSDELLLNAADPTPIAGTTYTWYAFNAGSYVPSPNGATCNVIIPATPGLVTFACQVQPPGVEPTIKLLTVEVGVRTDDTIMVAWIDSLGVTLPSGQAAATAGVEGPVLLDFPPGLGQGAPGSDPSYPFIPALTASAIVALAQNDDCWDFVPIDPLLNPLHKYSSVDKDYILNWMFKYSPNPDPTTILTNLHTTDWTNPNIPVPTWDNPNPVPVNTASDFTCYAGYIDYIKYNAYVSDLHRFKLFKHFQVKYRVNLKTPSVFNGTPIILQGGALIGATVNPTGIPPDFGPLLNFLSNAPFHYNMPWLAAAYANHTLVDPQAGPANGLIGPTPVTDHIAQISDGSPDIPAVRAFNTLMGLDVPAPLYWQNIGSKITFKCGSPTPGLAYENYPTYYFYNNGVFAGLVKQAKSPKGHFYTNPYPFGTYPSYGLPPQWPTGLPVITLPGQSFPTIPGGRNGVATTYGDSSSSTPAYSVP